MRAAPLLLLTILLAPAATADTRVVAYCDADATIPTCGVGAGDRDSACSIPLGPLTLCLYTEGGVGAGARPPFDVPPCPPEQPYCLDVHEGATSECVGGHGVYVAGHNALVESGGWMCTGDCDSAAMLAAIQESPGPLVRKVQAVSVFLACQAATLPIDKLPRLT